MHTLKNLWDRLTLIHKTDEDEARREYAIKVISAILFTTSCVIAFTLGLIVQTPLVIIPIILGTLWGLTWVLAERGYVGVAGYIPLLMFFGFAVQTNYIEGKETSAILLYVAVIILAAMLKGGWVQWAALGVCIVAYLGISWGLTNNVLPPAPITREEFSFWEVNVVASLVGVALLQWFYTLQYQQALARSRMHAYEVAAFRNLVENATDAIGMTDWQGWFVYVNQAFCRFFDCDEIAAKLGKFSIIDLVPTDEAARLRPVMAEAMEKGWSGEVTLQRQDKELIDGWLTLFPMFNHVGQSTGSAVIIRDMSERKLVVQEQERLQQEVIEAHQRALKELSSPVIPLINNLDGSGGIIVMPLIGSINTMRAQDITRALLAGISQHRAKVVIVDITGVPIVDTEIANYLNRTIQAARLKGADIIITGISDTVAETIVDLGIDWSGIETLSDLQTGLIVALSNLGIKLTR